MTLSEAYREIMAQITVTDEMRERVLTQVRQAGPRSRTPSPSPSTFRRYWAAAACLAVLVAGAAVLPQFLPLAETVPTPGVVAPIPDFKEVASAQALSEAVGFQVPELTQLPFPVTETTYTAFGSQMAQICYSGADQSLVFRMAAGTDDPSGDYTAYTQTQTAEIGTYTVTLKGDDGTFSLALWQDGSYSCSIRSSQGYPLEQWEDILLGIS